MNRKRRGTDTGTVSTKKWIKTRRVHKVWSLDGMVTTCQDIPPPITFTSLVSLDSSVRRLRDQTLFSVLPRVLIDVISAYDAPLPNIGSLQSRLWKISMFKPDNYHRQIMNCVFPLAIWALKKPSRPLFLNEIDISQLVPSHCKLELAHFNEHEVYMNVSSRETKQSIRLSLIKNQRQEFGYDVWVDLATRLSRTKNGFSLMSDKDDVLHHTATLSEMIMFLLKFILKG